VYTNYFTQLDEVFKNFRVNKNVFSASYHKVTKSIPNKWIHINFIRSWAPVIDFVESKYEEYLTAESRVHRKAISDSRVHSCLYFIAPSGHGLKVFLYPSLNSQQILIFSLFIAIRH
jgi:hypothetical protein